MSGRVYAILAASAVMWIGSQSLQAGVVAYYQFENSMASAVNSPTEDGTKTASATYVGDVPGGVITNGVGGPVVNAPDAKSYSNGTDTGGSSIPSTNINTAVSTGSFTIEAFVKFNATGSTAYNNIIGNYDSTNKKGISFAFDTNGRLEFRAFQVNVSAEGYDNSPNTLSRSQWHHVAAVGTYDGTGKVTTVKLYEDYQLVTGGHVSNFYGTTTNGPTIIVNSANLKLGAPNPFNGLIDEVRISNTALTLDQMLHVPEPGSMGLIGLAGFLSLVPRRRKSSTSA